MTTAITLARLRDLRLGGMAQALERQLEQGGTYCSVRNRLMR